mgnify:CR=1 FL=1
MKNASDKQSDLSTLPSIDALLQEVADLELPHSMKKLHARQLIAEKRLLVEKNKNPDLNKLGDQLHTRLLKSAHSLRKVINGTGVVVHTNLGRSPFSKDLFSALEILNDGYVNLELDLEHGRRGNRHDHLRPWIQALTQADDGILVNNNAAAVLLCLNTLADKKEVVISRGQLVEIGGSFRIPEILRKAGSKLIEVGTTNRTHLKDYESAISNRTKLLLWVHSSNYKITGFTKEVSLSELVTLGKKHEIPVMADLGSGALVEISDLGLQREPLVSEIIKAGVDLVTFSVDKLLGGPQGGIIAGKSAILKKIEKNNLLRALRPDKAQILLTMQSFKAFSKGVDIPDDVPIYRDFLTEISALKSRALQIVSEVSNTKLSLDIVETQAQVGSGASPSETMNSIGISIKHEGMKTNKISQRLRSNSPAIMGRINEELFLIDLKAVREIEDGSIIQALNGLK